MEADQRVEGSGPSEGGPKVLRYPLRKAFFLTQSSAVRWRGLKVRSDCADNIESITSPESSVSRQPPRSHSSQAPSGRDGDSSWRESPCRHSLPSWSRAVHFGTQLCRFHPKSARPAWPLVS